MGHSSVVVDGRKREMQIVFYRVVKVFRLFFFSLGSHSFRLQLLQHAFLTSEDNRFTIRLE